MRRRGWIALAVVVVVAGAAAIGVAGSRLVGRRTPAEARSPATAAAGSGPASATTMSSTRCTPTMGQPVRGWDGPTHGPPRLRLGPGLALRPTAGTLAASRRGRLMVVSGRVLTSGCAAVPGAAVRVWQTNGDGDYGPGQGTGQIRCCYLQGTMTTDAHGRFEFESVRPGNYSGTPHVHLVIRAPDGRGLETEVEFADDPGAAAGGGPVLHLADRGSRLHGSLDVVLG